MAAKGKLAFKRGPIKVGVLSFSGPASHKQRPLLFPTLLRPEGRVAVGWVFAVFPG